MANVIVGPQVSKDQSNRLSDVADRVAKRAKNPKDYDATANDITAGAPTLETSSHSTSQLVTGLVIVGAGGFLLWDGLRDHGPARPSTAFGVAAGRKAGSLFVRRSW